MSDLFYENRFKRAVALPSGVWLVLCAVYITVSVGWGNLFSFLPLEIAVLFLSMILPVFLFAVWYSLSTGQSRSSYLLEELQIQGTRIDEIAANLDKLKEGAGGLSDSDMAALLAMPNDIRSLKAAQEQGLESVEKVNEAVKQNRLVGIDDMQVVRGLPERISGLVETQSRSIQGLSVKLEEVANNQAGGQGRIDFSEIRQQTALGGLLAFVLNDINVSTTRLLVKLMEKEERSREEIKDFVQGLVSAYSMGDRNVFISVLQHQLANSQERVVLLQTMAEGSPEVSADISKIIRESKEIFSLVGQFADDNILATVFDDKILKALNGVLESHFTQDGTAIKFTVS